ncbi:LysR family transcriptional regulator [Oerskovia jenensis]|uniref:Molybdate transport repressor ModE-like protein n=1 Tax=Oerskovia jenensis TaxID=162169 RepID=A0ABS2LCL1_9CELL|nr:LysR family transcriptional regulator [Oerskovia jenensis]MBM7478052.1 molybdate transport repressor ModE-like protein [Oerskovia jenensis]
MTEPERRTPASPAPPRRERTSLALLELLVATDRHGSISAAARALGVSQPSASAGMRRLERHLDLELVTRSTRGARLTETGRAAATWAREVVEASDRFETSAAALREAPSARIRLAASLTIAEYLAPRWLATLAASASASTSAATSAAASTVAGTAPGAAAPPGWPGTAGGPAAADALAPDVELLVRNSRNVMELVLADQADLGFIESSTLQRGLRSRTLARDELLVVVAPTHPWASRRRRTATVDELLGGGLVVRERGSGTRETLEKALVAAGTRLPEHLPYLGSTASLKTAVQYGGAVAVLSRLTVADDLARGTLAEIQVPGLDLSRRLRMVWKDGTELSAAASRIAAVATAGHRSPVTTR